MSDSTNRPVLAASAACFRDGKLLLARRAHPPLLWTLPGGRVELGETAAHAARRELLEETGVTCEVEGFAGFREFVARGPRGEVDRHFVILAFAARWVSGEAQATPELSDLRWIEPAALSQYQTTEGLAGIVENAAKLLRA